MVKIGGEIAVAPLIRHLPARMHSRTVKIDLPIMLSLNKVSTGSRIEPLSTASIARKVYGISRLHHCVKVASKLFALDCKRIVDQARFRIPTALTVILRSRMVQLAVRQF